MKNFLSQVLMVGLSLILCSAQAEQKSSTCDGVVSILRLSSFVDGGSESGVRQAVAMHNAWYKSHGVLENSQVVVPVMEYDRATDSVTQDKTRIATLHLNSEASVAAREYQGDEGWKGFLNAYNQNTEVQDTIFLCLPNEIFRR